MSELPSATASRILAFVRRDYGACLLLLTLGIILRGVPELLISPYPVGYETIAYYAPALMVSNGGSSLNAFQEFLKEGPLFHVLIQETMSLTGVNPFLLLKIVGPLLYGVLLVSFFLFLRRGMKLDWKIALVSALLLCFQIAALRESWDRFRTLLSLVFLFAALTALRSNRLGQRTLLTVGLFSVLSVLTREYVALALFATVLGYAFLERSNRLAALAALFPSIAIFGIVNLPNLISAASRYSTDSTLAALGFMWTAADALSIFLVCYIGLLPFVVAGWRRDRVLWPMTVWLLIGSFSVLFPFVPVLGYQRWLMLLVFPFCVFAVWGFDRIGLFQKSRLWMLAAVMLIFATIGAGYSSGFFSYINWTPNSYVPTDLVESSIQWDQIDEVKAVLAWTDTNAMPYSAVLVEERFYGWTQIYLRRAGRDVQVTAYSAASLPYPALDAALQDGFSDIYLIWLTHRSIANFTVVHSESIFSVFKYSVNGS